MELDLQVKVEDEEFSSFVSELFDHHQDICDVKFVLPRRRRRSTDDEAEAVVDIVRAHNVVVCQSSVHSNLLRELFEKNKEKRDFEFCVRIQVQVDVSVTALQLFVKCLYGKLKGKICDIELLTELLDLVNHFRVPFTFIEDNLPLKPSDFLAVSERFLDKTLKTTTSSPLSKNLKRSS